MGCGWGYNPPGFPAANYTNPGTSDFKTQFARDFPYGGSNGDLTTVQDSDIAAALAETTVTINSGLFSSQTSYNLGFLRLSAHFLVMNLRASSQGIQGKYPWLTTSKGVGSVSEGITIPQRILDNPALAMLTQTSYGGQYLAMILPQLCGQIFSAWGGTTP